jgi:RNase H-fold protein (predicted Holliday junction resolvase)
MIPDAGRILGVDWGEVRIGLALSDESQTLATPLETLVRRAGKRFPVARLLELTSLHGPVGIVVGLPLSPEGTEEESAIAAREMADTIATRGRKKDVDALAASVVLQHFLDARRNRAQRAEGAEKAEGAEGVGRADIQEQTES